MKYRLRVAVGICGVLCGAAGGAFAADWYVATNGSDAAAGNTWDTAKQTIQAGVDAALNGDTVWVSNGVYATGERIVPDSGALTPNRVWIDKALVVRSVNGYGVTTIQGAQDPAAVRCVYMASNAVLSGFTLSGGETAHYHYPYSVDIWDRSGGGVRGENQGSKVNNCRLINNCSDYGGGASFCSLMNCLVISNTADVYGGGAESCDLYNCTLSGNHGNYGGGVLGCTLNNCIVYGNTAGYPPYGIEYRGCTFNHSCTTPAPGGSGNITNDPQFVDATAGDYHLGANSPCIQAGENTAVKGAVDLDGNPRVGGGS